MRHLASLFVIIIAALTCANAGGNTSVSVRGDSTLVVRNGDTTIIVTPNLGNEIKAALKDTLLSADFTLDESDSDEITAEDIEFEKERATNERLEHMYTMNTVQTVTGFICFTIFALVFLAMLFYYLHRRAKYRVVERAIDNNYPLSGTIFGSQPQQHTVVVQQPVAIPAQPVIQPQNSTNGNSSSNANMDFLAPAPIINIKAYRSAFILVAVSIGLMLFFAAAGATPMVALSSILFFLGLGKGLAAYIEQKNFTYYTTQHQAPKNPETVEHNQPQQPTPPPFRE